MTAQEKVTALRAQDLTKYVEKYVAILRDQLWLGEWVLEISVVDHPGGNPHSDANCDPFDGQKRAKMEFATRIVDDPAELKRTVAHELLHLFHRDQTDVIRLTMQRALGSDAFEILWESFRQQTELMVDNLTTALVPLLANPEPRR